MTFGNMRNRTKKEAKEYPRISFRIAPELLSEVDALKAKNGMSYGQIISRSLKKTLPILRRQETELQAA